MINIINLSKVYGQGDIKVDALKNIDFTVSKGEFVSIMGPSGSGKSTLMNILGCLDKPTSGDYILDNTKVHGLKDDALAKIRNEKIGFIFQSFNLLPKLSAIKNVELSMIYMGLPKVERMNRALSALEKVGLSDRLHHKPSELSGGQKQRVAIARALATDPAIILADEPTGNLDSKSTTDILKLFKVLNDEGKTIVIVTHEEDVAAVTNRIIMFRDGIIETDREVI